MSECIAAPPKNDEGKMALFKFLAIAIGFFLVLSSKRLSKTLENLYKVKVVLEFKKHKNTIRQFSKQKKVSSCFNQ